MAMSRFERSTKVLSGTQDDGNAFLGAVFAFGSELLALAALAGVFYLVHSVFHLF